MIAILLALLFIKITHQEFIENKKGTNESCSYGTLSYDSRCLGIQNLLLLILIILFKFIFVECGVAYATPNIRIVGGVPAVPNSWPAQVFILMRYKGVYNFGSNDVKISFQSICGGTLITPQVVLTASHCISTSFEYFYNGKQYILPISLNSDYPTVASMFTVYAGVNDISFITESSDTPPLPGVKLSVSNVIKVRIICI